MVFLHFSQPFLHQIHVLNSIEDVSEIHLSPYSRSVSTLLPPRTRSVVERSTWAGELFGVLRAFGTVVPLGTVIRPVPHHRPIGGVAVESFAAHLAIPFSLSVLQNKH